MKTKSIGFLLLLMLMGVAKCVSQNLPTYPIPSFNITVDSLANFRETVHSSSPEIIDGKKEINVQIKSKVETGSCEATIWVYSIDQTTVLGPFDLTCGNTLTVEIDDREWGVLVDSDDEILVDVWIE